MSDQPTAEAIAQAVAKLTKMLDETVVTPDDYALTGRLSGAEVAALRLLLTLAADYVPAQEREQAITLAKAWDEVGPAGYAEARRLLKLPARE